MVWLDTSEPMALTGIAVSCCVKTTYSLFPMVISGLSFVIVLLKNFFRDRGITTLVSRELNRGGYTSIKYGYTFLDC